MLVSYLYLLFHQFSQQTYLQRLFSTQGASNLLSTSWLNITFDNLLFKVVFSDMSRLKSVYPLWWKHCYESIVLSAVATCQQLTLKAHFNLQLQSKQLKLSFLSCRYITLFPFFQDWYLDWKIDNSIGIGLFVSKITFHSFCPNQPIPNESHDNKYQHHIYSVGNESLGYG